MTGQTRKTKRVINWDQIRAEYEAGATQGQLSRSYGVSRTAIHKHIVAEGWMQDPTEEIRRRVNLKVAGLVTGCDPKKKEDALNKVADETCQIIEKYRYAWKEHAILTQEARDAENFDRLKCLKIAAETMSIAQKGEYKAWGIKDPENEEKTAQASAVAVNLDLSDMTADELAKMARAAFRGESNQQ